MWGQQLVAPFRFERVEVAAPDADALQPGEVPLRLDATGICGSDLPYFKGCRFPSAVLREGRYVYVTHRFACNDANDAFQLAGRPARGQLNIVMRAR
jgi:hypothetical protein